MTDRERSLRYRCPYAGADHGTVLFGRTVRFKVTPSWWALPLVVCTGPMVQIGVLCFRLYWWSHDEQQCHALQDTVFT